MKKVLQVNLGGIAFSIDDDAYRRLDAYTLELERYFANSGNSDEIMSDIEARIAEIFQELMKARKIVEITDVEAAIKVMGTPAEFGEAESSTRQSHGPWDIKTGKKLFRDTDDKMIGGVCSGLAAYFGIEEVLWVRLGFAIVFLTMGFGLIVYLVLWALVPEAKTAADRLAMMGEPANAKNIGKMLERGIEDLSTTIKDNWQEWKDKKKSKRYERFDRMKHTEEKAVIPVFMLLIPLFVVAKIGSALVRGIRRMASKQSNFRIQPNRYV